MKWEEGLTKHPHRPHSHQAPDVGFRGREEEVVGEERPQAKPQVGLDFKHLVQSAARHGGIPLLLGGARSEGDSCLTDSLGRWQGRKRENRTSGGSCNRAQKL